jgi:predicted nucleic acid-binding protein
VADRWVINASPVILLAKAEVIQFLPGLCDELVIPASVVGEVENTHITDAASRWLAAEGKKFIQPAPEIHPVLATWRGGAGEAEVISWALYNAGFTAILDDRRARSLAMRNGIAVLGSLRVIVLAKERGFIPQAKPALERLRHRRTD